MLRSVKVQFDLFVKRTGGIYRMMSKKDTLSELSDVRRFFFDEWARELATVPERSTCIDCRRTLVS